MNEIQHSWLRPSRLVGREREQRILWQGFLSACVGNGCTVLVSGEAGIGKTALVERLLKNARARGATVRTAGCYELTSTPPYGPWITVLGHDPAEHVAVPAGTEPELWSETHLQSLPDQSALFSDMRQRLEQVAADAPLVILLEDLHWSDQESLELLRFAARSLASVPILLIITYRSDELTASRPLYHALPYLVQAAKAVRIDLRRFRNDEIRQVIDLRYRLSESDHLRLLNYLKSRTEGIPLFIMELLRSLELSGALAPGKDSWQLGSLDDIGVPLLIRQLVDRRLRQLDEAAQSALQIASALGHEIPLDLWISTAGEDEASLSSIVQQALDLSLLEQSPNSTKLRFRHVLVRDALYASMPLPRRLSLHRTIGESLAERSDVDPALVAGHFRRGNDARAANWYLRAARRAKRIYAPHAIVQQLTHLLDQPMTLDVDERIEAFRLRGWAHMITGDFHGANHDYLAVLQAAIDTNDRRAEWHALIRLAELWTGRDYQHVEEYVKQALQVTEELDDDTLMANSHNRLGTWCMSQDDANRARQHHERALEIWQQLGDQLGIAEARDHLGLTMTLSGDLTGAVQHYRRAIALFQTRNERQGLSTCHANSAHLAPSYFTDMVVTPLGLDACIQQGQHAREIASEFGYRAGVVYADVRLGFCLGARGAYQEALDTMHRSIADAEEIGNQQLLSAAHAMAGHLSLDLLAPAEAYWHAGQAREIAERLDSTFRVRMNVAVQVLAHLAEGGIEASEAELQAVWPEDNSADSLAQYLLWRARIELELARGNPAEALRCIDLIMGRIPHVSRQRPALRLSLLRGRALNALHEYDEAESWLLPARTMARDLGTQSLLWRIHRELGLAQHGAGDRMQASEAFVAARGIVNDIADTLSDPATRERYRAKALAQIPTSWTPTALQAAKLRAGGLTRRQREVAALIALGNSNRQIADQLSISERTVESHVTAILATLEFASRAQIVAWCIEHGLTSDI